jgi:hypothetical protein
MTSHRGHWMLVTILAAALLSACSTISTTAADGAVTVRSREEFEKYVEAVFRYQNEVGNDLISLGASTGQVATALQLAENRMIESCRYLNDVVVAHTEGHEPGLALKAGLMRTISECDRTAHDLGVLLQGGRETATAEAMPQL